MSLSILVSFLLSLSLSCILTQARLELPTPALRVASASPSAFFTINCGSRESQAGFDADVGYSPSSLSSTLLGPTNRSFGVYSTYRYGKKFDYQFSVQHDVTYIVRLHFAELNQRYCEAGKRVFSVIVGDALAPNDRTIMPDMDVAGSAGGCGKTLVKDVEVKVKSTILFIGFETRGPEASESRENVRKWGGGAMVSAIEILPESSHSQTSGKGPLPIPKGEKPHRAHSVPGTYEPFIDLDNSGSITVSLDGSGSHSHYYDAATGVAGRIDKYTWTFADTGKLVCPESNQPICKGKFPKGKSVIKLCVLDNSGSKHCDSTSITVLGNIAKGAYCYYYEMNESISSGVGASQGPQKPEFAAVATNFNFPSLQAFPKFPFRASSWVTHCVFYFTASQTSVHTFQAQFAGGIRLYADGKSVLAESSALSRTVSAQVNLTKGPHNMHLFYWKKKGSSASLKVSSNGKVLGGKVLSHDASKVLPVITAMTPTVGGLEGATVKLSGAGFIASSKVLMNNKTVGNVRVAGSGNQITFKAPPVSTDMAVKVVVQDAGGISNAVVFNYKKSVHSVAFTKSYFRTKSGQNFREIQFPTSIAMGPDFNYYIGSLNGRVYRVSVDDDFVVQDSCSSEPLLDPTWIDRDSKAAGKPKPARRQVLAVTFNPKHSSVVLYASTQTINWGPGVDDILDDAGAWHNGNVEEVVPISQYNGKGSCLKRNRVVISGLPVSNHDHAVNAMQFDNKGDLYINMGGFTNMGVPDPKLGGLDEVPLSAATIVAKMSKPDFDGKVTYSSDQNPGQTTQVGGDVSVYASGLRNSFGLHFASSGRLYATDNGPNKNFGDRSTGCTSSSPSSNGRDKVLLLEKGMYYGSPNRNRGECWFVGPGDEARGSVPTNYRPPIATVRSATTGIIEYTADTFSKQLKGDLILSKHLNTGESTFRLPLNADGTAKLSTPDFLFNGSGLGIVMGPRGELVQPQVFTRHILVLVPTTPRERKLSIIAVVPFRGAAGGGSTVIISGFGLSAGGQTPSALFGGRPCTAYSDVTATSFKCVTPPGNGLVDVSVTVGGATVTSQRAFHYMDV